MNNKENTQITVVRQKAVMSLAKDVVLQFTSNNVDLKNVFEYWNSVANRYIQYNLLGY